MKKMAPLGRLPFVVIASLVIAIGVQAQPSGQTRPSRTAQPAARHVEIQKRSWTGDFDGMLERRAIRVLVPYSRSLYFSDKGHERGITADDVRDFERWINKKYAKKLGKRPITVVIFPTTRDKLLPEVAQGLGDIAVGNLTVTEERRKIVDFVSPADQPGVKELIVTGPKSPAIATVDDLAGKTVHVRKASSYYESLEALNGRFAKERKPAMKIVLVPDALEDEDMLEMLNAGILEAIVVDDWKAKMWAQILPKIKVNEQAVVREGGRIGWAIRKGSPKLEAEILEFHESYLKKEGWRRSPEAAHEAGQADEGPHRHGRVEAVRADGCAVREVRAEVQLRPAHARRPGVPGVAAEPECEEPRGRHRGDADHAGHRQGTECGRHPEHRAQHPRRRQVHGPAHDEVLPRRQIRRGQPHPLRLRELQCGAREHLEDAQGGRKGGFDPDQWFNNVEIVTARKIGIETTTYVRNIYKYYVAYKLLEERREATRKAREQVAPGTGK